MDKAELIPLSPAFSLANCALLAGLLPELFPLLRINNNSLCLSWLFASVSCPSLNLEAFPEASMAFGSTILEFVVAKLSLPLLPSPVFAGMGNSDTCFLSLAFPGSITSAAGMPLLVGVRHSPALLPS